MQHFPPHLRFTYRTLQLFISIAQYDASSWQFEVSKPAIYKYINKDCILITLRAKLSGAVSCNRSCLFVCLFVCLWVCYHDKSKLRASIFTKLGL